MHNFKLVEYGSISSYETIIKNAKRRIGFWHTYIDDLQFRHNRMKREINLIRECMKKITEIKEALN